MGRGQRRRLIFRLEPPLTLRQTFILRTPTTMPSERLTLLAPSRHLLGGPIKHLAFKTGLAPRRHFQAHKESPSTLRLTYMLQTQATTPSARSTPSASSRRSLGGVMGHLVALMGPARRRRFIGQLDSPWTLRLIYMWRTTKTTPFARSIQAASSQRSQGRRLRRLATQMERA